MLKLHIESSQTINTYGLSDVLRLFFGPILVQEPLTVKSSFECELTMKTEEDFCEVFDASGTFCFSDKASLALLTSIFSCEKTALAYKQMKRERKRLLYQMCSALTGVKFPWGCLTGIRPSLVAFECIRLQNELQYNHQFRSLENYISPQSLAYRLLTEYYFLSDVKASLALETAFYEFKIAERLDPNKISIYIGIPFCPSRCTYCSFSAMDGIAKKDEVIAEYFEKLMEEMDWVCTHYRPAVNCIYIGGGTPTSLSAEQLEQLFSKLQTYFPKKYQKIDGTWHDTEWTLEAGRPDTMSEDKLWIAKKYGVDRICINPQTFHQKTLDKVNRSHAVGEIEKVYTLAKKIGFKDINMDLIAGLPNENLEDWQYNLACMEKLAPSSFTIHALALKRKSTLGKKDKAGEVLEIESVRKPSSEMNEMQHQAYQLAKKLGLVPYYMYRQKDGVGGLENVGYAKKGTACAYNVAMMGDQSSILGFGVGAMSKKKTGEKIERFSAYKGVTEYLKHYREHAEQKVGFFQEQDLK